MKPGTVLLLDFSPTEGHEQSGTRPAVVVAPERYHATFPQMSIVVPLTSRERGWRHHVAIQPDPGNGLTRPSFAMTEQVRTVSLQRIVRKLGSVSVHELDDILDYVHRFIA